MLKSMTGYGRAKAENDFREITVELKSVNHRYLDISIKAPRIYGFLDEGIKSTVMGAVSRGKIEVYVSIKNKEGSDVKISPNFPVIEAYLNSFSAIAEKYGITNDVTVMSVAKMSEAIAVDKEDADVSELTNEVQAVLADALKEYDTMRKNEGAQLCADILNRGEILAQYVDKVEARSPVSEQEYREKIAARMNEILGESEITEARILAEAALFADKISITEEIVRLRSHLKQLKAMITNEKAAGRKLDFLVQELNRETNTIGSKANDGEIAKCVIEMKAEIEKIREQIQNLE